ncbi:hypothetical protein D3C72_2268780 [compost metagenome]
MISASAPESTDSGVPMSISFDSSGYSCWVSCMASGSNARTLAPAAHKDSSNTRLGASRMSSVFGLNARPHTAKVLPRKSPW